MSDYTKTTNFTAKDSLPSGDSNKLIVGADFDTEFAAIATAIATKFDSNDIATQAQAQAESSNAVLITPAKLADWGDDNAGMVGDIRDLADPGADTVLGWDDSAGAAISFTLGAGLTTSTTTLKVDFATELGAEGLTQSQDGFIVSDNGSLKTMPYDQAGAIVASGGDADKNFAITDANTVQYLYSESNRTYTILANSSVDFEAGSWMVLHNYGGGNITLTADTGVYMHSIYNETPSAATSDTLVGGGTALLLYLGSDHWLLTGDITD